MVLGSVNTEDTALRQIRMKMKSVSVATSCRRSSHHFRPSEARQFKPLSKRMDSSGSASPANDRRPFDAPFVAPMASSGSGRHSRPSHPAHSSPSMVHLSHTHTYTLPQAWSLRWTPFLLMCSLCLCLCSSLLATAFLLALKHSMVWA